MSTVATMTTTTVGLKLEPLDVLFFRDGRPFTGSERSISGLPMPQTLAGGIRTALLRSADCDFRRLGDAMKNGGTFASAVQQSCPREFHWIGGTRVRGPWIARRRPPDTLEVLVPIPAVLHQGKRASSSRYRLTPLPANQLPGWNPTGDQEGLRPLWLKELEPTEPAEGYFTPTALDQFLRGEVPPANETVPAGELFALDFRTGIGISPDRLVAEDSQIFGRGFLALRPRVVLYGEVVLPDSVVDDSPLGELSVLPLGGEGRNVLIERLAAPHDWPSSLPTGDKQKSLVVLTTPCAFQAGWKPRLLADDLVAAAVPGSLAYSGWDLARGGPKPTRFAVPAGSTYFLEQAPRDWPLSLAESDDERQQGWGCYLTGVWTDD
jgi:CRISPR-associated protein Cmr3